MTGLFVTAADFMDRFASRTGPWFASLLIGLTVIFLASLTAAPTLTAESQIGIFSIQLAANPFDATPNPVAPRFLTPLLSWLLGLRGQGLIVLIGAICILLPTAGARWALAKGYSTLDALLAAGVIGLTLLTRTSLHYAGVPDVTTYVLVFGIWVWRARPRLATLCFFLALLNHERALFLLPWVAWLLWRGAGDDPHQRRTAMFGLLLAAVAWLALHLAILHYRDVEQSLGYYLQPMTADPLVNIRQAWPHQPLGLLSAFQWVWLLPIGYGWNLMRRNDRAGLLMLALPVLCACCQMLFAYDSSRLAALAFPCLLPALDAGLRDGGPTFRRRLLVILLLQAITPQVFTAMNIVEVFPTWL